MEHTENNIDVAIWMVTYNHEKYILECIESIISQKTDFTYRLFIGEDGSTDKTREICLKLKKKYPEKITLFAHEKNLGPIQNANFVYKACHESGAKYIAMCEGDDYWVDHQKLQRHYDFLEKNKAYVLVADNSYWYNTEDNIKHPFNTMDECDVKINSIVKKRQFGTASVLFRNLDAIASGPTVIWGDTFLFALLAREGKFKYFPTLSSVYRRHSTGITNTKKIIWAEEMEKWNKKLHSLFPEIDYAILREKNLVEFRSAAVDALHNKRTRDYLYCSFKCIWYKPGPGFKFFYTNLSDWIGSKFNRK